jgi:hypothetical protein
MVRTVAALVGSAFRRHHLRPDLCTTLLNYGNLATGGHLLGVLGRSMVSIYLILRGRTELGTFTGMLCTAEGILVGYGYLLVTGLMPGVTK